MGVGFGRRLLSAAKTGRSPRMQLAHIGKTDTEGLSDYTVSSAECGAMLEGSRFHAVGPLLQGVFRRIIFFQQPASKRGVYESVHFSSGAVC
jgi:hypothetical protein